MVSALLILLILLAWVGIVFVALAAPVPVSIVLCISGILACVAALIMRPARPRRRTRELP